MVHDVYKVIKQLWLAVIVPAGVTLALLVRYEDWDAAYAHTSFDVFFWITVAILVLIGVASTRTINMDGRPCYHVACSRFVNPYGYGIDNIPDWICEECRESGPYASLLDRMREARENPGRNHSQDYFDAVEEERGFRGQFPSRDYDDDDDL